MPATEVLLYCDADGESPVKTWLDEMHARDRRAYNKCLQAISRLASPGHELRRPTADILEHGIHELRTQVGRVNYRVLYFFHGRNAAVLVHGLTKERAVPATAIQQARERKWRFEADPRLHTLTLENGGP